MMGIRNKLDELKYGTKDPEKIEAEKAKLRDPSYGTSNEALFKTCSGVAAGALLIVLFELFVKHDYSRVWLGAIPGIAFLFFAVYFGIRKAKEDAGDEQE